MFEGRVRRSFEAVHRKDLAAVMRTWADDGVLEFPGHSSLAGRYEGRRAIEGFFRRWFERMAVIEVRVTRVGFSNPITLNRDGTMYVEFETDQRTVEGVALHSDVVGVYRFCRGKLAVYREFVFDPSAAEAIWGPATTSHAA